MLLLSKNPRQYRLETAGTERYLTDAVSKRILSKSKEACEPSDATCRTDFIVNGVLDVVKREFDAPGKVQDLRNATAARDSAETDAAIAELLANAGIVVAVIVVAGGAGFGVRKATLAYRRMRRRREVLKAAIKTDLRVQSAKAAYPEWFVRRHVDPIAKIVASVMAVTENPEFDLAHGPADRRRGYRPNPFLMPEECLEALAKVATAIDSLPADFELSKAEAVRVMGEVRRTREALSSKTSALAYDGFRLPPYSEPAGYAGDETDADSVSEHAAAVLRSFRSRMEVLSAIEASYAELLDFQKRIPAIVDATAKSDDARKAVGSAMEILGSEYLVEGVPLGRFDPETAAMSVAKEASVIALHLGKKDLEAAAASRARAQSAVGAVERYATKARQDAATYAKTQSAIDRFRIRLGTAAEYREHREAFAEWKRLSGKRDFDGFVFRDALAAAGTVLASLAAAREVKDLPAYSAKERELSALLDRIDAYHDLPARVSKLKEEIRREEERKAREAAERKRREEEEEERRAAAAAAAALAASNSRNDDTGWSSGGGGGWSGGGATSD